MCPILDRCPQFWGEVKEVTMDKRNLTPCDYQDENGQYRCPYEDCYTGYEGEMCRVCCGLGADE